MRGYYALPKKHLLKTHPNRFLRKHTHCMKLRMTLLLAAVLMTVAACAPSQELRNPGFLQDTSLVTPGEECKAPCWRGITPGETEWSAAISIIEDQADITNLEIETNDESGELAATFQRRDGVPCCLLYSRDGIFVDQMLLQLASGNAVGGVIDNLGEPDYFNGTEVDENQAAAALFFPDRGLVLYAFIEGLNGSLSEESEVFAALFLSQTDMEQVLQTSTLQAFAGYKAFADYLDDEPVLTPQPLEDAAESTPAEGEAEPAATEEPTAEATTTP